MSASAIVTDGLTKTFGGQRGIVDVSVTVEPGQVFGFLGPNGAGKSTTIRCLLGLYRPTRGRAEVLGRDPREVSHLRDVGYLPGELRLPDLLTGAEVIRRFAAVRGLVDTAYRDELVERFDVDLGRRLVALSKGNKQKLGLVLAFMHRPALLVLDEPTSGLDPLLQDEFASLVQETVADGRTVLLSSHDLDEVQRVVQRVVIIRSGRIVVDDTVEGLRARAPRRIEASFGRDVDTRALAATPGVTLVGGSTNRHVELTYTGTVAPVLHRLAELAPDSLTARPASLDELFLRLYGGAERDAH